MQSPQAFLGLTIASLAGLAVLLVAVIIWISLRFYNENARMTQETSELHARMGLECLTRRRDGGRRRQLGRIGIGAGGDRREGDRPAPQLVGQLDRTPVARREELALARVAAQHGTTGSMT